MDRGLTTTLRLLIKTENEAAIDVLLAAVDTADAPTRHAALRALLERRSANGHREVFRRLPQLDEASRAVVEQRGDRLLPIIVEALQGSDPDEAEAACQAMVGLRLYDAVAPLIGMLLEPDNPRAELAARTIVQLTEQFYTELSTEAPSPRELEPVRKRLTASLEEGARKYHRHLRSEVVEALLLIAKQNNATLRSLLSRPDEKSHEPILKLLACSEQGGILRLLLGFLEDATAPRPVLETIGRRCDVKFVDHLLQSIGTKPSRAVTETLGRITSIEWAVPGHPVFAELSEAAQAGAVHTLLASGLEREKVLDVLGALLREGKPAGRRAAAAAMAQFGGPKPDAMVLRGLADPDPEVRAELIVQLRNRGIPEAMSLLIRMIDSPEECVRAALHRALPEFTFRQFLRHFDAMDEMLRPVAGHMVLRLEDNVEQQLVAEMECVSPVRRRRAVQATIAMGLAGTLEHSIVKLLSDEDHMVRVAAAQALADAKSMPTWEALRDALLDRSYIVQEAAEKSLERLSRSLIPSTEEAAGADSATQRPAREATP